MMGIVTKYVFEFSKLFRNTKRYPNCTVEETSCRKLKVFAQGIHVVTGGGCEHKEPDSRTSSYLKLLLQGLNV